MTVLHSKILTESLDYYLGEGKQHLPDIYNLTKLNTDEVDEKIMR